MALLGDAYFQLFSDQWEIPWRSGAAPSPEAFPLWRRDRLAPAAFFIIVIVLFVLVIIIIIGFVVAVAAYVIIILSLY